MIMRPTPTHSKIFEVCQGTFWRKSLDRKHGGNAPSYPLNQPFVLQLSQGLKVAQTVSAEEVA